ncbi:hypothetical protein BHM03_00025754 [Ensete ventricosum]|nr:hypothetical protein BHM03_00025754 [Ensete ventricosum]
MRNRSVTVNFDRCRPLPGDFDHRQPLLGGNDRFQPLPADFRRYQSREGDRRRERRRGRKNSWSPLRLRNTRAISLLVDCFFFPHGENEATDTPCAYRSVLGIVIYRAELGAPVQTGMTILDSHETYVLYTAYTLTTAITEWSSVLYSVLYTALPTVVVGILDKDLSRRTLLKYPRLYGAGQREERYNLSLFILTMMDAIWQSLVVFFIPYLAYRDTTVDGSSLGDLWTLAVVTLVNIHLAMDVFRWNWITHLSIWGSIAVAVMCVILIDSIWFLPGYW